MKRICAEHLSQRYCLETIDIYKHPEACKQQQIIAAPTLIKVLPHRLRRIKCASCRAIRLTGASGGELAVYPVVFVIALSIGAWVMRQYFNRRPLSVRLAPAVTAAASEIFKRK